MGSADQGRVEGRGWNSLAKQGVSGKKGVNQDYD
jgi:hypothetical protein